MSDYQDPTADEKWRAEFKRLLLVVSGSINAAFTPLRVSWVRSSYPELDLKVVVTPTAERFITLAALSAIAGSAAMLDQWDYAARPGAMHTALNQWAEAVLVIPATLHYLARVALGLADSPSILAIQCTEVPVVIAPSLPPGGWESPVVKHHLRRLSYRPNVSVIPPVKGLSFTTGRTDGYYPPALSEIFKELGWTGPAKGMPGSS